MIKIIKNIDKMKEIPSKKHLVVMEKGAEDTAIVLYGFDELGLFENEFKNPVYGLASW